MCINLAQGIYKYDLSSNWKKAKNFTPKNEEIIYYTDLQNFKIGDGVTKINDLPFLNQNINNNFEIYQGEMRIING